MKPARDRAEESGFGTVLRCVVILATATVLGIAYNRLHPAGLRAMPQAAPVLPSAVAEPIETRGAQVHADPAERLAARQRAALEAAGLPFESMPQARAELDAGRAVFIDLRDADAYARGHVPRAASLPAGQADAILPFFGRTYATNISVRVGCIAPDCREALRVATTLLAHGYADVRVVYGAGPDWGYAPGRAGAEAATDSPYAHEWLAVEVVRPTAPAVAAAAPAAPGGVRVLTWKEVEPRLRAGALVLVDARPAAAYQAGHIPGAISLPFAELESHIAPFIEQHLPDRPIVTYCDNRNCPVSKDLAQRLAELYGYADVAYMPGGFLEWRVAGGGRE